MKEARRREQEEVGAERPSAAPDELIQVEQRETPYCDKAAGKLASPRDDEAHHHTDRKEQECDCLARCKSQHPAGPAAHPDLISRFYA